MPEYLAPGVFVEEVSFRSKSIEGVGTSVAGIVGPTRFGPLRGKPEVVTSFAEFSRIFGDAEDIDFGGTKELNHTAISAKAFFDNGGKQLFVVRTVGGVNGTNANSSGSTALTAHAADTNNHVTFSSRFPGAAGNCTLELRWRDSENLLKMESTTAPNDGDIVFLSATGVPKEAKVTGASITAGKFPIEILAVMTYSSGTGNYTIDGTSAVITDKDGASVPAADVVGLKGTQIPADAKIVRVIAKRPTSGALAAGTSAVLTFSAATSITDFTGGSWGSLTTLYGTLNATGTTFTVDGSGLNTGVGAAFTFKLAALGAAMDTVSAVMVQRNFDIDVHAGGADGEVIYTYADISTAKEGANSLPSILAAMPEKRYDQLTSPLSCSFAVAVDSGDKVVAALYDMFDEAAMAPTNPLDIAGPRYLISLALGSDGTVPGASDYAGETDEVKGSTGFAALEDIEDVSIVMVPAAAEHTDTHQAIVAEMQKHCNKMRYRVGIVDAQRGMSLSEIRDFRSNFDDSRLALYYPWIVAADPTGQRDTITVPPSGFVAGVYANTDVTRGVHKPPANETVMGALRFAQDINRFQQELLNPNGVNCLRSFPGRGHRVWGGRTLSSDPEWKYVNVRRYFLYLERSIDKSTQWVVFEPNGELLWENVRSSIEDFLYNEWFNRRLLGGSPDEAYFVRCDRSTMTQNDIDNGRLVCLIGVAALKPAEFVIFRIGQKTASAQS